MIMAVVRSLSQDYARRNWAYDNAPHAWLLVFVGWICVVLSGIPLVVR
jgi:hypothetical protein